MKLAANSTKSFGNIASIESFHEEASRSCREKRVSCLTSIVARTLFPKRRMSVKDTSRPLQAFSLRSVMRQFQASMDLKTVRALSRQYCEIPSTSGTGRMRVSSSSSSSHDGLSNQSMSTAGTATSKYGRLPLPSVGGLMVPWTNANSWLE